MKTIQSLIETPERPKSLSRQESREVQALSLAKTFLTNMLNTEYFFGPCKEGNSPRRQALLKEEFNYFMSAHRAFKGPVGRLSAAHIGDFLERFLKYQLNNKKVISLPALRQQITQYKGAAK